jgi:hypothetical protein
MVAVDTGILSLMFAPGTKPPTDPSTGNPTERAAERVEKLVDDLDLAKERVIISTPVLSEFLILAGDDGPAYLAEIANYISFTVRPFDQMAAIELASLELQARKRGSKRSPASPDAPWQKVKVDRQIVAIAKVNNAHTLYSDDGDVRNIAEEIGIKVVSSWQLPLLDL